MHPTAFNNGRDFFSTYSKYFAKNNTVKVIDIGAQDVNGSLKELCPPEFEYIGVDFQEADGVDIVLNDPYELPFESESIDIVVSSSCFEHSEMFWLSFLEILRVLKPNGLFYLNVPSAGSFHRYPVDCWRFYPDSGEALSKWGRRNGFRCVVLESYTQEGGDWNDFVSVFFKDEVAIIRCSDRIILNRDDFFNGKIYGDEEYIRYNNSSQAEYALKKMHNKLIQMEGLLDAEIGSHLSEPDRLSGIQLIDQDKK